MSSVISLANEWHIQIQREATAKAELQAKADKNKKKLECWNGLPIHNFTFENDEFVWGIKQLCTFNELINEGRNMKHCVASYVSSCANGKTAIFHVSGHKKGDKSIIISNATVEIRAVNRLIVQIKGKCNSQVDRITLNIIKRWASANSIKINIH